MPKPPDPAEAAVLLRRLLDAVADGELDASATTIAALAGALSACEALAEGRVPRVPAAESENGADVQT
jgi:hypothetical protein